jgi:hypothetical protein
MPAQTTPSTRRQFSKNTTTDRPRNSGAARRRVHEQRSAGCEASQPLARAGRELQRCNPCAGAHAGRSGSRKWRSGYGTVILFFSGKLGVGSWEARASLTAGRQRYRGDTFWLLGNVGLPVRPMLDIAKFIIDHINLQMTDVGHRRRGAKIQQRRSDEQPSRKRWKHEQRAKLTNSGSLEYIELTTGSPLNFCRTRQSRRGGSHRQATRLARFGPTRMHLLSLHSWLN